jgi:hypothetical protein
MWSKTDSGLEDIARKYGLKGHTASPGCYEGPSDFGPQSVGYLSSDKNISINATLHFDVIVRQVMALSLERIIWYDFNCFLHVEIFVQEPFFSRQKVTR